MLKREYETDEINKTNENIHFFVCFVFSLLAFAF
jgi:hypothetical protein